MNSGVNDAELDEVGPEGFVVSGCFLMNAEREGTMAYSPIVIVTPKVKIGRASCRERVLLAV